MYMIQSSALPAVALAEVGACGTALGAAVAPKNTTNTLKTDSRMLRTTIDYTGAEMNAREERQ
jgi:hypothetical protein